MKVLITGGTGQLGAAIVAALMESGHTVRCLVRSPQRLGALQMAPRLVTGDLADPASLEAAATGMDAVVHTAGLTSYWSRRQPDLHRVNVVGTRNILAACRSAGVGRLLYTSTIGTLGYLEQNQVGDETTAFNWDGMGIGYFETKAQAEHLVLGASDLEGVAVNPGIVFGPGDVNVNGLRMLLRSHRSGAGSVPPGATTVAVLADVARGHVSALERGRAGQRYVLGGTELSFWDLFGRIADVVGSSGPRRVLSKGLMRLLAGMQSVGGAIGGTEPLITRQLVEIVTRNRRYQSKKAVAELAYAPTPIETGLAACWEWYQASLRKT